MTLAEPLPHDLLWYFIAVDELDTVRLWPLLVSGGCMQKQERGYVRRTFAASISCASHNRQARRACQSLKRGATDGPSAGGAGQAARPLHIDRASEALVRAWPSVCREPSRDRSPNR
jgi:hypothetical protein